MAFLTPDKVRVVHGLEIKEKILPASLKPNRKLSKGTGKAEYVTIHNTKDIKEAKGTNDAEQYARATFNGNMKGVSVHDYIDETDCWQILKDDEVGYHAADGKYGPGNDTSIAIEIIMDGSGSAADKKAEERGALLAAIKLHENGLGIDRLTTHNHWYPKKYCPAYILPHWSEFKKKVENYLAEIKAAEKAENQAKTEASEKSVCLYKVQAGSFGVEKNAKNLVTKLKAKGFEAIIVKSGKLFKVQAGSFGVKKNAEALVKKLKAAGFDAIILTVKS